MSILSQIQPAIPSTNWGPQCPTCSYFPRGERYIAWDGTGQNGVLILADSPWDKEIEKGYLLAGPSGYKLESAFKALGVSRKAFLLANGSMWCKPPHLGWSDHPETYPEAALALAHCRPHLDDLLKRIPIRACVALGSAALRRMTGQTDIGSLQCYVLPTDYGFPVIPTYHPSYLFRPRKQKLFLSLLHAIRKALDIAGGAKMSEEQDRLLLDPPLDEARAYLEQGLVNGRFPTLYVDIETPRAKGGDDGIDVEDRAYDTTGALGDSYQLLRVGLSHSKNTALTMAWQPPYIDLIKWALERADLLIQHAHNHYDSRRLRANTCTFTGRWASSMWAWRFYQSDMDKALEFAAPFFANCAPWKHLSNTNPAFYNAVDVVRMADVWLGCKAAIESEGRWAAFMEHCVRFDNEIIQPTIQHGILVDKEGKDRLMRELDVEIAEEENKFLQTIPEAARKVTIKQRKPKNAEGYVEVTLPMEVKRWRKKAEARQDCAICSGAGVVVPEGVVGRGKRCTCLAYTETIEKAVWRREEFNSRSTMQVRSLLKELGITVPKKRNKEGEFVETTGKKQLQKIAKKNEQIRPILLIRSKSTLRSNYDWDIDVDGRVRTFYGFNTATWRLNSWHNNLAIIPSRGDMAPRVRRNIIAAPGHVLGEVDSSGIEAVLVGYYARSERYVRLAKAGVHGWLTSVKRGQPVPLDLLFENFTEFQRRCKQEKRTQPKLYNTCKPIIHGTNFDESAWGIFEQNPEDFESLEEAEELRKLYLTTLPGQDVVRWQEDTRNRAHSQRSLQNAFGGKHWFFGVYTYNKYRDVWEPDNGGDGKRCLAFLPQSTASFINRFYGMDYVDRYPAAKRFLRLFTYDSITIEYPESLGEQPTRDLAEVMSQPIRELDGLPIGVEAKVGYNLAEMREIPVDKPTKAVVG